MSPELGPGDETEDRVSGRLTDLASGRWTRRPEDAVRPLFRDGQE